MNPWVERRSRRIHQDDDARTSFEVDYARIIHSASFRRLQGKTQILNVGDGDFYRTRLTHTLEVAQIAGGLVRQFERISKIDAIKHLPDSTLVQVLGLAHDLGHPPFGHGGEVALNYCMRDHGGFEGNGQSLRIVSRLEKMSAGFGADLTRRALLGVLKYPVPYSVAQAKSGRTPVLQAGTSTISIIDRQKSQPPKCYLDTEQDVVDWVLEPLNAQDRSAFLETTSNGKPIHKSFDCSIMDVADDIAYGIHDLEDAIAVGLVTADDFKSYIGPDIADEFLKSLSDQPSFEQFVADLFGASHDRKRMIGRLVHHMITRAEIRVLEQFDDPLLRYRAALTGNPSALLLALKDFVLQRVIKSPKVQQLEFKGQKMVVDLFEVLQTELKLFLPADTFARYEASGQSPRVLCDYVAGMTDSYLMRTFERFFSPRMGSIFDRM